MDEEKSICKCKSKCGDLNSTSVIGGIIAYELAVVIILLIFILLDLDKLSDQPSSDHEESREEN